MIQYDPTGIFEQNPAKGGVNEIKDSPVFTAIAATNNQQVIAAVAGRSLLILGGTLTPLGAAGVCTFKSATGGTLKHAYPVHAAPGEKELPIPPWGNFSTNSGEGLFVDNTSVANVVISLRYIEVVP